MVEQAIQMALQPCTIYHKMQQVFLRYEEGALKGQKPRELKGLTLQKALEGRFAPKLTQFKVFQGLKVCVFENVMTGIIEYLHFRTSTKYTCSMACWMGHCPSVMLRGKVWHQSRLIHSKMHFPSRLGVHGRRL